MKPRSFTPLCLISRSSSRSTAWWNVACDTANAMWCTQPGSVGVRSESGTRSSLVKIVISRPSPGSKYRWLSAALSRLGCSNTNGIPSTPSQKSIDVCRSAPTSVMWWTPWLCSLRIGLDATPPVVRACPEPGAQRRRDATQDGLDRDAGDSDDGIHVRHGGRDQHGEDRLADHDREPWAQLPRQGEV